MELDTNLINMIKSFQEQFEFEYYGIKGMAKLYIKRQEKDINKIEHLLDNLMNSYLYIMDAKEQFFELCDYLETIAPQNAMDYRQIWQEDVEDVDDIEDIEQDTKKLEKEL